MKILIVSSYESTGGAARAALRLHDALLAENIDSSMLVQERSSNSIKTLSDLGLIQKGHNKIRPTLDLIPTRFYKNKDTSLFSPSILPFSNVVKKINQINPDIVHLHWICGGMIKIEDLSKIVAPIVWSLHDNWAFTGGCHIKLECNKYKDSCGSCPRLKSKNINDLSRRTWKRKMKTFSSIDNLNIIGLSRWLNRCSLESSLLKDKKHFQLPNPINTKLFKRLDKIKARELWNIPQNKKIILCGSLNINDKFKGFAELIASIDEISTEDVEIVVFGSSNPIKALDLKIKAHYVGKLSDEISMATLYSLADLTLVPSLSENLSNVIMESLSCETPVVGFDVGGNSDLIEHKKTGYLVKSINSTDLARGIDWVLQSPDYINISKNARQKILDEFDFSIVAKKYVSLYRDLLKIN